jgi:hypothetical protein
MYVYNWKGGSPMLKVADEVWIATALLHREHPRREDFSIGEIVSRAAAENIAGELRPGVQIHASNHCVASKTPNPARHRMLAETQRGRRRLFREGDYCHPDRRHGKVRPDPSDLPPKYSGLADWYDNSYSNAKSPNPDSGAMASQLKKFAGVISKQDAKLIRSAIEQGCEQINPNEW